MISFEIRKKNSLKHKIKMLNERLKEDYKRLDFYRSQITHDQLRGQLTTDNIVAMANVMVFNDAIVKIKKQIKQAEKELSAFEKQQNNT